MKRERWTGVRGRTGAMLTAVAMLAAACGSGNGGSDGNGAAEPPEDPTTGATEAAGDDPIAATIGFSAPLSGPSADAGEQMRDGCQMAIDQANAEGDVDITLDVQDDESDPTVGTGLVDRFLSEGAVAIAGVWNSPVGAAMQPIVNEEEIPLVMQGINSGVEGPYVYHTVATDAEMARAGAVLFDAIDVERPAIMTDTTAFGSSALPVIESEMEELGLEIVASETFEVESEDLSPQMLSIEDANADGLFLWSVGPPIARGMVALDRIGYKDEVTVVANFTAADPVVYRTGGESVAGLLVFDMVHPDKPKAQEVIAAWEEAHGEAEEIPVVALVTWDQCSILAEGIRAGATTGPEMKEFLDNYCSEERASGKQGAVWRYTAEDHDGLEAEDIVITEFQADGERVPTEQQMPDPQGETGC